MNYMTENEKQIERCEKGDHELLYTDGSDGSQSEIQECRLCRKKWNADGVEVDA